jgi:hypothetical protein
MGDISISPSHQIADDFGCTELLFSTQSIGASLNKTFVKKVDVRHIPLLLLVKGYHFGKECRCI